jgi:hypothetical protein
MSTPHTVHLPDVVPVAGTPPWDRIEPLPELPMPVFASLERWHPERIGALAIYCSDGRWGEAFDEFCHKHLQIPRYDRLAVAGGPAWLVSPTVGDFHQGIREQLDFLARVHELERIVLITHYGCAFYGHKLGLSARECLPVQGHDVRSAVAALRQWYPELSVEGFLAHREGNCLSFHEYQCGRP